jgi:hypothetical protein
VGWDWVYLVRRPLIALLYQPRMIDEGDCGAIGGMRIWQGKPKYSEKTYPSATFPPQIPHDLIWDRTLAAAMGSQRLTAWAMAWRRSDLTRNFFASVQLNGPSVHQLLKLSLEMQEVPSTPTAHSQCHWWCSLSRAKYSWHLCPLSVITKCNSVV